MHSLNKRNYLDISIYNEILIELVGTVIPIGSMVII